MHVRTKRLTSSVLGVQVVPAKTVGEIVGDGYERDGVEYVAVDFGTIVDDFPSKDLEIVCPDCGGVVFWSEEAGDWLHEANDASCFLTRDLTPEEREAWEETGHDPRDTRREV